MDFLKAIMGTGSLPRGAYVTYSVFKFGSSCINPIVCLTLNSKIRRKAINVIFFKRLRRVETNEEPTKETMPELTVIRIKRRGKDDHELKMGDRNLGQYVHLPQHLNHGNTF